jgi:hypothetical protein
MTVIYIPNDNPHDAINISRPGDTLIFEEAIYVLDRPLYITGHRTCFSQRPVIFRKSPNFQPDPTVSDSDDCMIIISGTNNQWLVKSIMGTGWMQ